MPAATTAPKQSAATPESGTSGEQGLAPSWVLACKVWQGRISQYKGGAYHTTANYSHGTPAKAGDIIGNWLGETVKPLAYRKSFSPVLCFWRHDLPPVCDNRPKPFKAWGGPEWRLR